MQRDDIFRRFLVVTMLVNHYWTPAAFKGTGCISIGLDFSQNSMDNWTVFQKVKKEVD